MGKKKKLEDSISRVEINGKRYYKVIEKGIEVGTFPSVTSILGSTKDKSGLDNWRNKIGDEAADKIGKDSTDRGTVMHRLCELYLNIPIGIKSEDKLQEVLEIARHDEEIRKFDNRAIIVGGQLFYNFYNTGMFEKITKVVSQEQFLWSKAAGGYAGTVDNFSLLDDGSYKVIDFKTAKKAKNEEWIEGYKLQVSAYCIAIWERLGIKPDGAEIWISNEKDRFPQCFQLSLNDIRNNFKVFTERAKLFHELHSVKNVNI